MEEAVEAEIAKNSAERILNKEKKVYFVNNRILPLQKFIKPEAKIFDVGCWSWFIYSRYERFRIFSERM
ncbi:hypothetical protein LEP1GSC073_0617 [Leptospira noguchii str. Cascata]|nr:hypothetical protein LEP1GSC073_0617 [Leptospira noguchii str. Cascata]